MQVRPARLIPFISRSPTGRGSHPFGGLTAASNCTMPGRQARVGCPEETTERAGEKRLSSRPARRRPVARVATGLQKHTFIERSERQVVVFFLERTREVLEVFAAAFGPAGRCPATSRRARRGLPAATHRGGSCVVHVG